MSPFIDVHSPVFPWHLHPAQLYALAQQHGISQASLLQAAELSPEHITNSELLISWRQYRAMAELLEQQGPSHWGILLGQQLTIASHGLLSLAVMNCSDWRQILQLIVRFKNLVTALFYIEQHDSDDHVLLLLRPEFSRDPLTDKFVECFFLAIYQGIVNLSSFRDELVTACADFRIYLQQPQPDYADLSQQAFDHNLQYGHWCSALKLHRRYLDTPIMANSANPIVTSNMVAVLNGQMQQLPRLHGELHALHQQFKQHNFTLEGCASALHTSPTTLKRRLKQACSSFNQELVRYRYETACYQLCYSRLSADDISQQLGFQEVGSFRRFFKTHTSLTPNRYRQAHSDQAS